MTALRLSSRTAIMFLLPNTLGGHLVASSCKRSHLYKWTRKKPFHLVNKKTQKIMHTLPASNLHFPFRPQSRFQMTINCFLLPKTWRFLKKNLTKSSLAHTQHTPTSRTESSILVTSEIDLVFLHSCFSSRFHISKHPSKADQQCSRQAVLSAMTYKSPQTKKKSMGLGGKFCVPTVNVPRAWTNAMRPVRCLSLGHNTTFQEMAHK